MWALGFCGRSAFVSVGAKSAANVGAGVSFVLGLIGLALQDRVVGRPRPSRAGAARRG